MNNFNFYLNTLYKLANQAIKVNELPINLQKQEFLNSYPLIM